LLDLLGVVMVTFGYEQTYFPLPRTPKSLKRLLGMIVWYRKFISNFAAVSAPLTNLLKPRQKFIMTPEGEEAFKKLKKMLCAAPVLRSPDFSQLFYIHCDASNSGVGGVLVQKSDSGEEYPKAFVSKKLNKAQKSYKRVFGCYHLHKTVSCIC